jgi:hypothetical protein
LVEFALRSVSAGFHEQRMRTIDTEILGQDGSTTLTDIENTTVGTYLPRQAGSDAVFAKTMLVSTVLAFVTHAPSPVLDR